MKPWIKILIGVVAALLLVFIAVLSYVMSESFQKGLIIDKLSEDFEDVALERVSIGFSEIQLEGLSMTSKEGARMALGKLNADYSWVDVLFSGLIRIGTLTVEGVEMEAGKPSDENPLKDFKGLFQPLREDGLPLDIGKLSVGATYRQGKSELLLTAEGGDIGAGRTGKITFEAEPQGEAGILPPGARGLDGELQLALDGSSRPESLKLQSRLHMSRMVLSADVQVKASGDAAETYQLAIRSWNEELISGSGRYDYGAGELKGSVKLALGGRSLIGFVSNFLDARLGQNSLLKDAGLGISGEGQVTIVPGEERAEFEGRVVGSLDRPDALDPNLNHLGGLDLESRILVKSDTEAISLSTLKLLLSSSQGVKLVSGQLLEPLVLPLSGDWKLDAGRYLELDIDLPFALLDPWLPSVQVSGGQLRGRFILEPAQDGSLIFHPESPLTIQDFSILGEEGPRLEQVDVELVPEVILQGEQLGLRVQDLVAKLKGQPWISGAFQLQGTKVQGSVRLFMDALQGQPVASGKLSRMLGQGMMLAADFEVEQAEQQIVHALKADLLLPGRDPYLNLELLKPFEVPTFDTRELATTGELVRMRANAMPLALLNPLLETVSGYQLDGKVDFDYILTAAGSELSFVPQNELLLSNLDLSEGREALLRDLSVSAYIESRYDFERERARADIRNLAINSSKRVAALGSASVSIMPYTQAIDQLKAELDLHIEALMRQPWLRKHLNLRGGRSEARLEWDKSDGSSLMQLHLRGVTLANQAASYENYVLNWQGSIKPLEPFTAIGTLNVAGRGPAGNSSARVEVDLTPGASGGLKASGDALIVDDLLTLAEVYRPAQAPKQRPMPTSANTLPDQQPFWSAFYGGLDIQLKLLRYEQQYLENLTFKGHSAPTRLQIDKAETTLNGAPTVLSGKIDFEETNEKLPYNVDLYAEVLDLPIGHTFGITAWVDGLYSAAARIYGRAASLDGFGDTMMGEAKIISKSGRLTFFSLEEQLANGALGPLGSALGAIVGTAGEGLGEVAGLLGAVTGVKVGNIKEIEYVKTVLGTLQELQFFNFEMDLIRGESLDIQIPYFRADGKHTAITSPGIIRWKAGSAFSQMPIELRTSLLVKGWLAESFSSLGMISGEADEQGYYPAYTFPVQGPLGDPDFRAMVSPLLAPLTELVTGKLGLAPQGGQQGQQQTQPSAEQQLIQGIGTEIFRSLQQQNR